MPEVVSTPSTKPPPPTVVVTETASTTSNESPQSSKSRKFIKFSPRLRKKSGSSKEAKKAAKENAAAATSLKSHTTTTTTTTTAANSGGSMEAASSAGGGSGLDHSLQIPNGLNDKEKQELQSVFEMFDKNRDGKISCEELGVVLRTLGHRYSHAEIEDMIKNADKNDNGFVEYDEFVLLMKRASAANSASASQEALDIGEQACGGGGGSDGSGIGSGGLSPSRDRPAGDDAREAFQIFDMDGNGFIDRHELRFIMSRLGENPEEEDICEMFRHADLNGDGLIDYGEFTHLMTIMTQGGIPKGSGSKGASSAKRSPSSSKSKSKKK